MRARRPDERGLLDRDGVRVAYEVHGDGDTTIVFIPAFPVADERNWKAQVPHFARDHRVLILEARGHGRSDRPTDPDAYRREARVGDVLALLDETDTDRAVLVTNSQGGPIATSVAADHPDRVLGVVGIGAALDHQLNATTAASMRVFGLDIDHDDAFRFVWQQDYPGFVALFTQAANTQPHSTKPIQDLAEYAFETNAEVLTAFQIGDLRSQLSRTESLAQHLGRVTCPVLLIHGTDDLIVPVDWARRAVDLLPDARLEIVEGGAHCVYARRPVLVNRLIDELVAQVVGDASVRSPGVAPGPVAPPSSGDAPRILYLSSPIGLGHARRDVAIADELRSLAPGATIDWLAQDPVTRVLAARDETIHPASHALANESSHLESETDDHDLHVFEAIRRMDEILVNNFMVFLDVVRDGHYDLVVGDEAWEVDHYLHEEPPIKATRFAWLTDFVGYLPVPAKGERDVELTADYNAEMIEHVEGHPEVRDRSIFVGNPDDVVDRPFGPGLPSIHEWTRAHYDFSGYITGFNPAELTGDRDRRRAELGYAKDQPLCIAAVGGSGVGTSLLRRILTAHPIAARSVPGLRTVVVTGPRIDPASLPDVPGVDLHAYVPDLHRHLAVADLAVVQGGLTTTMELTATGVPFLYVPLLNHFEQQFHVRHRLARYGAGVAIDYASATADSLAEAMVRTLGRPTDYTPVESDGARRAAELILEAV